MEQLTLEQAANNYITQNGINSHTRSSFFAGAEWQKEQFKELLPLIKEAMVVCSIEGQDDIIERIEAHISNLGLEL